MDYKAILEFMTNGYEHGSDAENRIYLQEKFGFNTEQVDTLIKGYPLFKMFNTTVASITSPDIGIEYIKNLLEAANEN